MLSLSTLGGRLLHDAALVFQKLAISSITETESMEKFRPDIFRMKGRKSRHVDTRRRFHHPVAAIRRILDHTQNN